MSAAPREKTSVPRVCVVLFVDISGSTRLYEELGDAVAARRVRSCLDQLRDVIDTHQGRVVKHIGDGLMCEFAEAAQALAAADAMQVAVEYGDNSDPKLGIHVGCHLGPVIENAGDLFGDAVNIAARVAGLARTGQIITTAETSAQLHPTLQRKLRLLDRVSVKGRRDSITVLEYLWRSHGDLTVSGIPAAPARRSARLRISVGAHEVWLGPTAAAAVRLGRDAECEIIVRDVEASRQHATIEVRGDKFILLDHSSNGTYVAWEGVAETCLRREEMILPARGHVALGLSTSAGRATLVAFSLES